MKMETQHIRICVKSLEQDLGENQTKYLYLKTRKVLNKCISFLLMKLETGPIQPKASQRKETIKIKTEINEVGNRKITEKISETKAGSLRSVKLISL